jgi:hypothetical protein
MRILRGVAAPATEGCRRRGAEIGGDTKGPYHAITDGLLTAAGRATGGLKTGPMAIMASDAGADWRSLATVDDPRRYAA